MRLKGISAVAFCLMLCGLAATTVHAQLNRSIMEGIVSDPQGAVIAGADVTVTAVDTNVAASTKTNSTGYYRVVDLVPGKYRVHFSSPGFTATDVVDVNVTAGELAKVDAN